MIEFLIYLAGYLVTWRLMFRAIYNYHRKEWPILEWEGADTAFAVGMSTVISLIWPAALFFFAVFWVFKKTMIPSDIRSEISGQNDRNYGHKNPVIENPVVKDGAFNITSLKDWYKK